MRGRLSTTAPVNFEEFFIPYTTTLSLNWPYLSDQVLQRTTSADANENGCGGIKMNEIFETHLRDIRNWSLGSRFKHSFPDLVDDVRIHDVIGR